MQALFRRLAHFLRRSRYDAELREEIETHRALRQDALEREGLAPDEAAHVSARAMGNVTLAVEDARDVWIARAIGEMWQDTRIAIRVLRRSPSFACAAIGTLALSIGANTAIFSVVHAALVKPLPYPEPENLVAIAFQVPTLQSRFPTVAIRPVDFEELRRSNDVFSELSAVRDRNFNLTGSGEPERLYGARASANIFTLLGVQPALGRTFLPDEDAPGHETVIVISHDLWRRRFGGGANLINQTVFLDGQPHIVVGVMPSGFLFPTGKQLHPAIELGPRIDVWKPAAFGQDELQDGLTGFSWGVIGRLKPGARPEAARANLDVALHRIAQRMRGKASGLADFELRSMIVPLREVYFGNVRQGLVMVMGATGLLLVIGCVNLVNLLLARLTNRSRELASRAALGASRGRLIRQMLTESVVVACLGGVVALPLAAWTTGILVWLGSAELSAAQATLDRSVLMFAMIIVLGVGLAMGLLPAIEMTGGRLYDSVNEGGRGTTAGGRSARVRGALVMSEVALCTALLIGGGLLLRSLVNILNIDHGFQVEHVLSLDLALTPDRYQGSERVAFYRDLLDDLRALPGVASAGAISILPLTSESEGNTFLIYFDSDTETRLDRPIAHSRAVTTGYFAAMGIPLAAGRHLEAEEPGSNVVVSEGLARRLWPDASLSSIVGRRIKINEVTDDPATIVGIVGDVRAARLDREPTPALYVPYTRSRPRAMSVVIRAHADPALLASAIRQRIRKHDDAVPIERMTTMRETVSASIAPRRFQTMLVVLFALLALALALVGVYGVTSYAVTRQTREFGVRLALGAQRRELLRGVLTQHLYPVAVGLLLGLALGWIATIALRSILFGVAPLDPLVLASVCVTLSITAAAACYLPARRASRVDPVIALRHE